MKTKASLQIDALTVCFTPIDTAIIDSLVTVETGETMTLHGMAMKRVSKEKRGDKGFIYVVSYPNQEGEVKRIGTLYFDALVNEPIEYVWFKMDNRTLYDPFCREYMAVLGEVVRLQFHCITNIDIACDTNICLARIVDKAHREPTCDILVNGEPLDKSKSLEKQSSNVKWHSGFFCRNALTLGTLYVWQSNYERDHTQGASMRAYNKRHEVTDRLAKGVEDKTYILDHYSNPPKLYRVEVSLPKRQVREWQTKHLDKPITAYNIFSQDILTSLFYTYLTSMLQFRVGGEVAAWQRALPISTETSLIHY